MSWFTSEEAQNAREWQRGFENRIAIEHAGARCIPRLRGDNSGPPAYSDGYYAADSVLRAAKPGVPSPMTDPTVRLD